MRTTSWLLVFCGEGKLSSASIHLFARWLQSAVIQRNTVKGFLFVSPRFIFMWRMVLKTSTLRWRQGEGTCSRFFFCSASRRAPRSSSTFRKGGEGKVKASLHLFLHRNDLILNSFSDGVKGEGKKRKLADMRVHACAREKMERTIVWNMACLLRFFPCFEWYR